MRHRMLKRRQRQFIWKFALHPKTPVPATDGHRTGTVGGCIGWMSAKSKWTKQGYGGIGSAPLAANEPRVQMLRWPEMNRSLIGNGFEFQSTNTRSC